MIPSSTCSSSDPIESDPVNSMATHTSDREMGHPENKQTWTEGEKQVIVNNYYISDRENGWKQLARGEILPDIPGDKRQLQ